MISLKSIKVTNLFLVGLVFIKMELNDFPPCYIIPKKPGTWRIEVVTFSSTNGVPLTLSVVFDLVTKYLQTKFCGLEIYRLLQKILLLYLTRKNNAIESVAKTIWPVSVCSGKFKVGKPAPQLLGSLNVLTSSLYLGHGESEFPYGHCFLYHKVFLL